MRRFGLNRDEKWHKNRYFYAIDMAKDRNKIIWLLANYLVILQRFSDWPNAAISLTH